MKFEIVCVRDIVANCYSHPQFVPNLGSAIRAFGDQCRDKNTQIGAHPEDYELYHLGTYDDQDAAFRDVNGAGIDDVEKKQIAVGANYRGQ